MIHMERFIQWSLRQLFNSTSLPAPIILKT